MQLSRFFLIFFWIMNTCCLNIIKACCVDTDGVPYMVKQSQIKQEEKNKQVKQEDKEKNDENKKDIAIKKDDSNNIKSQITRKFVAHMAGFD